MASEEADGRCERLLCDRWARGQVAAMKKSFDREAPTEPGGLPPGETRPYIKTGQYRLAQRGRNRSRDRRSHSPMHTAA